MIFTRCDNFGKIICSIFRTSFLILTILRCAESKATARIFFGTFVAPASMRCDLFSKCDFKFRICIDSLLGGSRMSPCTYHSLTTAAMGGSPINLSRISPMNVQIDKWQGGLLIKIEVLDFDRFSKDDVVDTLTVDHRGAIGTVATYKMRKRTTLPMTITTSCEAKYYGNNCDIFCEDSNTFKYRCNPYLGTKICLPGWTGTDCESKFTSPTTTSTTTTATTTTVAPEIDLSTTSRDDLKRTETTGSSSISIGNETMIVTTKMSLDEELSPLPVGDPNDNFIDSQVDNKNEDFDDPFERTESVPILPKNLRWICGSSFLTSPVDFNTSKTIDDVVSVIIAKLLTSLAEYSNSTLNFDFAERNLTRDQTFAIKLDYCVEFDVDQRILAKEDLQSLVKIAYDNSSAAVVGVQLSLQIGCERDDHHANAEAQNTGAETNGVIWAIAVSLLLVFLALGVTGYIWTRREKRKMGKIFAESTSLSYSSPIYCTNDDQSLAIIANEVSVYSTVNESQSHRPIGIDNYEPQQQNGTSDGDQQRRVENEYVVM